MEDFASLLENSFKKVYNGDVLDGTIIEIQKDALLMDVNSYMDGVLPMTELLYEGEVLEELYHVGESFKVMVIRVDSREGMIYLSKKEADAIVIWDSLEQMQQESVPIEVQVKEIVKGGLRIEYKGIRGFLPQYQIDMEPVEDPSQYVGKTLECLIQRIDREKRDIVVSRKELLKRIRECRRRELLESLEVGSTVEGRVVRLESYGAFVELAPGVDGMIHISELAWTHVKHPSDVLSLGDRVQATVLRVDQERGRIALRLKDIDQDPWSHMSYTVGTRVDGCVVSKILSGGAIVELEPGIEGFLPISMISERRLRNVREALKEGDTVDAKVHAVDTMQRRITLTMLDLQDDYGEYTAAADAEEGFTIADAFKNLRFDQ